MNQSAGRGKPEAAGVAKPGRGGMPRRERSPRSFLFLWLLFVSLPVGGLPWEAGSGYRSAALPAPTNGKPGFVQLRSSETGVAFSNDLSIDRYTTNQIHL